jgi:hypothetical protein
MPTNKFIISFPRSGSHLTFNVLEYLHKEHKLSYSECEFYTCCKQTPCPKGRIFQKNHDFLLDLPILDTKKYIVLYRKDKIKQLDAYYRFTTESQWKQPYDIDTLSIFCKNKSSYYDDFMKKWLHNHSNTNILSIDYETIVAKPYESYKLIMSFLYPDLLLKEEAFIQIPTMKFCGKEIKIHNNMNQDVYMRLEKEINKK